MTPEKTKKAFDLCFDRISCFCQTDKPPTRIDSLEFGASAEGEDVKAHLRWMCVEGKKLVDENRMEKAMRWLGFVQGAMWLATPVSIEMLKMFNKPEGEGQ